jgi:DNA-binding transcriptional ArsR family regulator
MKAAYMPLDTTFAALADPTRRAILSRLAQGEATVNELASPFAISQPAVSRHIKVLEDAGLILRRIQGTHRPCRLAPLALDPLDTWLRQLRDNMERNYQRLDELLAAEDPPSAPGKDAP